MFYCFVPRHIARTGGAFPIASHTVSSLSRHFSSSSLSTSIHSGYTRNSSNSCTRLPSVHSVHHSSSLSASTDHSSFSNNIAFSTAAPTVTHVPANDASTPSSSPSSASVAAADTSSTAGATTGTGTGTGTAGAGAPEAGKGKFRWKLLMVIGGCIYTYHIYDSNNKLETHLIDDVISAKDWEIHALIALTEFDTHDLVKIYQV